MSEMVESETRSSDQMKTFKDKSGKELTSEEVDVLPEMKRRIRALQKLQFQKQEIDGELEKEILELIKTRFHHKYQPIFEKRFQIVSGSTEPNEEECDFETESSSSIPSQVDETTIDGVPGFWLKALQNYSLIREWIQTEDEPALNHLIDITVVYNENPSKFVLEFRFKANDYFKNEVLTKEYDISFGPDPNLLWDIVPYSVVKRKGCKIDWKDGKKLIPKKVITNAIEDSTPPSFFCFFEPPKEPKDKMEANEELEDLLWDDWQIGLIIVRQLVPNAILCYTGDLAEDGSDSESSQDSYSEYSESEED